MLVARNVEAGRLSFSTELGAGGALGRRGVPGGRHAVAPRRRLCRSVLRLCGRAKRSRAEIADFTVVATKSTVPVGTNDEIEAIIRKRAARRRFRGRLQSGIPARRRGDRGLQASGPGRRRHRGRARAPDHARHLPAAVHQRDADPVHRTARGGADQVRRQRVPRDQDHVHQRDGGPVREVRRRRPGGGARHGARPAHRPEVPARRSGIRRLVLPEGHRGADRRSASATARRCGSSKP